MDVLSFPPVVLGICAHLTMSDLKSFLSINRCARNKYKKLALVQFWRAHTHPSDALLVDVRQGILDRCQIVERSRHQDVHVRRDVWRKVKFSHQKISCFRIVLPSHAERPIWFAPIDTGRSYCNSDVLMVNICGKHDRIVIWEIQVNPTRWNFSFVRPEKLDEAKQMFSVPFFYLTQEARRTRTMLEREMVPRLYTQEGILLPFHARFIFTPEERAEWIRV